MDARLKAQSAGLRTGSARLREAAERLRQQSKFVLRRSHARVERSRDLLTISLFQCHPRSGRGVRPAADPDAERVRVRLMA
jgi:hypothetical protein